MKSIIKEIELKVILDWFDEQTADELHTEVVQAQVVQNIARICNVFDVFMKLIP